MVMRLLLVEDDVMLGRALEAAGAAGDRIEVLLGAV